MNVADAHSGTVEVSGGVLAYDVIGHGPPVILIHAAIADRRMWDRELLYYPRRYRLVRYDLRGFGRSTPAHAPFSHADDLLTLVDELGFDCVDLIGSSLGGTVAMDFALDHPQRVRKLVLASSGFGLAKPSSDPRVQESFRDLERRFKEAEAAWKEGRKEAVAHSYLATFGCALVEPERSHLSALIAANLEEIATDRSMHFATGRLDEALLGKVRAPTLMILGTRDHPAIRWSAHQVAEALPECRCLDLLGADHFPSLSRPADFDAAVFGFLAR